MVEKLLSFEARNEIRENYKKSVNRLLLLDYDGTLVNIQQRPEDAKPDARVLELLDSLAGNKNNTVVLISGRDHRVVNEWFRNRNIIYAAEHGAIIKMRQTDEWIHAARFDTRWKPQMKTALEQLTALFDGSFVEEKEYSLVWHYRQARIKNETSEIAGICEVLQKLDSSQALRIQAGKKNLEVGCAAINKGLAASLLVRNYNPSFVLALGDDATDEDMFAALAEENYTIKVGLESTRAKYCVINPGLVLSLLEFLEG